MDSLLRSYKIIFVIFLLLSFIPGEHGFQFGQAVIIANRTDACMYDIHINTNAVAKPDCFLTNLTNLAYFVVDSHEKMFYYVDDRSSAIIQVDMISKSQKVIYTDTAASISGNIYRSLSNSLLITSLGLKLQLTALKIILVSFQDSVYEMWSLQNRESGFRTIPKLSAYKKLPLFRMFPFHRKKFW